MYYFTFRAGNDFLPKIWIQTDINEKILERTDGNKAQRSNIVLLCLWNCSIPIGWLNQYLVFAKTNYDTSILIPSR